MFKKYDLVNLQNHPANVNQDHLTICGFFTTEEEFEKQAKALQDRIEREGDK